MKNKISVVIAAYNEALRIANVLKIVEHDPLIDEVILKIDRKKKEIYLQIPEGLIDIYS